MSTPPDDPTDLMALFRRRYGLTPYALPRDVPALVGKWWEAAQRLAPGGPRTLASLALMRDRPERERRGITASWNALSAHERLSLTQIAKGEP